MRKNLMKIMAILMCFTMMAAVNVFAAPITTNQAGTHDGYYYNFWTDGVGSVAMTLGPGGNYSVDWSNCGNFICGKGWETGSANRIISYAASFNPGSNSFLSVWGMMMPTTNPNYNVEYYVVENYGAWTPPGGTSSGTISSDGGTYNLYRTERNSPGVIGLYQYWSVRTSKRLSGTVTMSNHFNAWASMGWIMGTHRMQLMAIESYQSSGSANVTVSEGPANPTPTPIPTATPTPTLPGPTATPTGVRSNFVVSYVIQNSWGTGGTVSVAIQNNSSVAVNGWTLVFNLPSGTTISNLWGGVYTQSGTTVTVKNASYNRTIPANGGSVNFGFNYKGSNGAGSGFTLNGTACAVK